MDRSSAKVVVVGPASWNHLIELDHLPEPVPHMQFARGSVHTIGGTSAGKALHLAALGADVRLHAMIGPDADGHRIVETLGACGVPLVAHASGDTERHVNLMTERGERVSLYVSVPPAPSAQIVAEIADDLLSADIAVVDLSEVGAAILAYEDDRGALPPVWVDLHDYDGVAAFHAPFLQAADVVFMNGDRTDDAWELLRESLTLGPRLAVCTLGAHGAIALDAEGRSAQVDARPGPVIDTNGAGDAFMAGFLAASLGGGALDECLSAGADQALVALSSHHLHPAVEAALAGFTHEDPVILPNDSRDPV